MPPKAKPSGSKTSHPKLKHGPKKCPDGETKRVSFNKKGYTRVGKDGKKMSVQASHVGATCVPSKGKALIRGRKTKASEKVLPKFNNDFHLRSYGYGTHKSVSVRHAALKKAAEDIGAVKVLQHLGLARNYNADPKSKKVMAADVKFLSIEHAHDLEKAGKKSHSVYLKKAKKTSGSKTAKKASGSKTAKKASGSKTAKKASGSKTAKKASGSKTAKKTTKKTTKKHTGGAAKSTKKTTKKHTKTTKKPTKKHTKTTKKPSGSKTSKPKSKK